MYGEEHESQSFIHASTVFDGLSKMWPHCGVPYVLEAVLLARKDLNFDNAPLRLLLQKTSASYVRVMSKMLQWIYAI